MACNKPQEGYKSANGGWTRNPNQGYEPMTVPCGVCMGCRITNARMWTIRQVHEAQMHKWNCFVTLTYAAEHLPPHGSLDTKHMELFIRKLRKYANKGAKSPVKIRYFQASEYGEVCANCLLSRPHKDGSGCKCAYFEVSLGRPHHHIMLFNWDFPDKKIVRGKRVVEVPFGGMPGPGYVRPEKTKVHRLYTSELCNEIWGRGECRIGSVEYGSAQYLAKYVTKKITGKEKANHYRRTDRSTGETWPVTPEFIRMSNRPGIGADWFRKYTFDCFPSDEVVIHGTKGSRRFSMPRYYDKLLARWHGDDQVEFYKKLRIKKSEKYFARITEKDLERKEEHARLMNKAEVRGYEQGG